MSADELAARSKSDGSVKCIAVLHLVWFLTQVIARYSQLEYISPLEIITCTYGFWTIFIYVFLWNQPQNVEYPVTLKPKPTTSMSISAEHPGQETEHIGTTSTQGNETIALTGSHTVDSFLDTMISNWEALETIGRILVLATVCAFNALHCIRVQYRIPYHQGAVSMANLHHRDYHPPSANVTH